MIFKKFGELNYFPQKGGGYPKIQNRIRSFCREVESVAVENIRRHSTKTTHSSLVLSKDSSRKVSIKKLKVMKFSIIFLSVLKIPLLNWKRGDNIYLYVRR